MFFAVLKNRKIKPFDTSNHSFKDPTFYTRLTAVNRLPELATEAPTVDSFFSAETHGGCRLRICALDCSDEHEGITLLGLGVL